MRDGLGGCARAAARLLLLAATTSALYAALLAGLAACRLRGAPSTRWRLRLARLWARGAAAILGMRVASSGRAPSPPFLLVANHLSYVDVVLLMSRVEAVFVARADVAGWPVLGRLARAAGTIFVARERARDLPRAAARIERALRGGAGVVLFPEGTSTEGAEVLPFRPSLLSAAVSAGAPVAWAALTYATPRGTPSARRAVCWWGEMRFAGHFLRLLALPRFDARVVFGEGPVAGGDRKEIAARARRAVAATFVPVPIEA